MFQEVIRLLPIVVLVARDAIERELNLGSLNNRYLTSYELPLAYVVWSDTCSLSLLTVYRVPYITSIGTAKVSTCAKC